MTSRLFATLGEYSPTGFFTKTHFSDEQLRLGVPGEETYEEYWFVRSTILHEWCHHLQVLGTSYGRYAYHRTITCGDALMRSLRSLIELRGPKALHRPFSHDMESSIEELDWKNLTVGLGGQQLLEAMFCTFHGTRV